MSKSPLDSSFPVLSSWTSSLGSDLSSISSKRLSLKSASIQLSSCCFSSSKSLISTSEILSSCSTFPSQKSSTKSSQDGFIVVWLFCEVWVTHAGFVFSSGIFSKLVYKSFTIIFKMSNNAKNRPLF